MISETAPLVVDALLQARITFTTWAFGSGLAVFTVIALGSAAATEAICTTSLLTAMLGGLFVVAGPCVTIASWTAETDGASIGKDSRSIYEPYLDHGFGLGHNYDAATHFSLNQSHGEMLSKHNTTILAIVWMDKLPTANHTGGAFENLDMSLGRIMTLSDNGVIRAAVGHTSMMESILDSFNDFKTNKYPPAMFAKRDLSIDWVSFNTYGENMNDANGYQVNIQDVKTGVIEDASRSDADIMWDTSFAESNTGMYHNKFCLGVGPMGQSAGSESIIVGEVYMNRWGGIDEECQSAWRYFDANLSHPKFRFMLASMIDL